MNVGALARDGGVEWRVWAPEHAHVDVVISAPVPARHRLARDDAGYHSTFIDGLAPGARYQYALDDELLPDPASRAQPNGVHGESAVIASDWDWMAQGWTGRALTEFVVYELHVGTFTRKGTFDAVIEHLDALRELGITAIEIMPVAEFPGARNWGYDGVFPYAAQSTYGGPDGLRRLVDACHERELAIVLDVVYNHLGPEGNVLGRFAPYFTDRYRTPWGDALNFDGRGSDEVRNYFVGNALHWVSDFRIDGLRLDAVHAIADPSAYPFVEELTDAVHACAQREGRQIWVIAESATNDARLVSSTELGGIGCDAQWNDDFHHALHALLTGECAGYYADFGALEDLATASREAFVYANRYSRFRGHRFGRPATAIPGQRFVVYAQNHDQIGNRAAGDRLASIVDTKRLRVAAAAVLCAPFVPLLFMGEEYGETNPFPYFVDHSDPRLLDAVRRGRAVEFPDLAASQASDPAAFATFESARLDRTRHAQQPHAALLEWYRELLALRRERPALHELEFGSTRTETFEEENVLIVHREAAADAVVLVLGFGDDDITLDITLPSGWWRVLLDSHAGARAVEALVEAAERTVLPVPGASVLVLGREPIA